MEVSEAGVELMTSVDLTVDVVARTVAAESAVGEGGPVDVAPDVGEAVDGGSAPGTVRRRRRRRRSAPSTPNSSRLLLPSLSTALVSGHKEHVGSGTGGEQL